MPFDDPLPTPSTGILLCVCASAMLLGVVFFTIAVLFFLVQFGAIKRDRATHSHICGHFHNPRTISHMHLILIKAYIMAAGSDQVAL